VMPLALAGHTARHAWSEPKPTVAEVLDPTGTGFRDDLLDLGAAGGFVDAVLPDGRLHAQRPADPDPLPADREV
jgi:hypothetical protein